MEAWATKYLGIRKEQSNQEKGKLERTHFCHDLMMNPKKKSISHLHCGCTRITLSKKGF